MNIIEYSFEHWPPYKKIRCASAVAIAVAVVYDAVIVQR